MPKRAKEKNVSTSEMDFWAAKVRKVVGKLFPKESDTGGIGFSRTPRGQSTAPLGDLDHAAFVETGDESCAIPARMCIAAEREFADIQTNADAWKKDIPGGKKGESG